MAIEVKYFYSACVKISFKSELENKFIRILCDPWFTSPIYYGSWFQYPEFKDPLKKLGDCDFIYISHIHPDHYDPTFLNLYMKTFGRKKIIIQDRNPNFLMKKMLRDGFEPIQINSLKGKDYSLEIFPFLPESKDEIDSALVVKNKNHCVVNMNDCHYSEEMLNKILDVTDSKIDIALMQYTTASSYPQCYFFDDSTMELHKKRIQDIYYKKFEEMRTKLSPKLTIPFAGQYSLGGQNFNLNSNLGVLDAVEVATKSQNTIVLEELGSIDTKNLLPSKQRIKKYSIEDIHISVSKHKNKKYDYDSINTPDIGDICKLSIDIFNEAFVNSPIKKIFDFYLLIEKEHENKLIEFKNSPFEIKYKINEPNEISINEIILDNRKKIDKEIDYLLISIPYKLLWGILIGKFHWNNVYVASLAKYDRYPEFEHRKDIMNALNFIKPVRIPLER